MTNLTILSYGRENEYQRAILAVLSYHAWLMSNTIQPLSRTVIFTDNPAYMEPYFEGLTIEYILLTAEKIKEMKGPAGFIHRMKIAVIAEVLEIYPNDDVFYIDSDTFIVADPTQLLAQISPQRCVMHLREYQLGTHSNATRKLIDLLESKTFKTSHGQEHFGPEHYSWNAGVLGLSSSTASYLPDVFLLTDKIYLASGLHTSEQIAFSLLLQNRSEIIASDDVVFHYWPAHQKVAVDALVRDILTRQFVTLSLAEKLRSIRELTLQLPNRITEHLKANPDIELRINALYALSQGRYIDGYGYSGRYLLKKPNDTKFMRDVLYYTKRILLK